MRKISSIVLVCVLLLMAVVPIYVVANTAVSRQAFYKVEGTDAHTIQGFAYNGTGVQHVQGKVIIKVNDGTNTGFLKARIDTKDGEYLVSLKNFTETMPFMDGGIATDLTLHGASGRGPPVLPEVFAYAACWGNADLYKDGVFNGSFEAHFMVTQGVREDDHKVYNANKTDIYDPANPEPKGRGFLRVYYPEHQ